MAEKRKRTLANTWIGQVLNHLVSTIELVILRYYNPPELIALIRQLRREDGRFLFRPSELVMVHSLAAACREVPGDYAEVGVFRGTSARMICAAKGDKSLYLFDTFAGLPDPGEGDERFSQKQFTAEVERVKRRLDPCQGITICPGLFPGTGEFIADHRFAFVHLDVDLYSSTRDSLEFFYSRMSPGGIILSHDYAQAEGVRRAFDEFFGERRERVIRLPMSQCMVICGI